MAATSKKKNRKARPVDEHALVTDVESTCRLLGKCRDGIYDLIKAGELESYLDGRMRRITLSSIRDYVARKVAASVEFRRARYPTASMVDTS